MQAATEPSEPSAIPHTSVPAASTGTGEKNQRGKRSATAGVLADGAAGGAWMVGALDHAQALLAWLVSTAPTSCVATPPREA